MNWTVLWRTLAENQLATLWTNALDRAAVTRAADTVDRQLQRDPFSVGESRDEVSLRVLFEKPLVVEYQVDEENRAVYVLRLRGVS
jgi:hypothetical protein